MTDHPHSTPEPSTPLAEQAAGLHEAFLAFLAAGFTEWQALRIIGVMVAEGGRQS
jgi:hypothetical protein